MFEKTKGATGDVAMVSAFRVSNATYSSTEKIYEFRLSTMDGELTDWLEFDAAGSVETKKATADIDVDANDALWENAPYKAGEDIDIEDGDSYYVVPNTMLAYASKDNAKAAALNIMKAIDTEAELGTAISCKISNGKFALKSVLNNDSTPKALYVAVEEGVFDGKFNDNNDSVTIRGTKYYAENAKVFEIDFDDKDKTYESLKSLKEIEIDDLESLSTVAFVTDIDYSNHTFGTMVLTSSNIKGEKKWAYITKISDYDDNDDKTKENTVVEVIFEGEDEATELYADDSKVDNLALGVAEIEVEGNVITKPIKINAFTDGTLSGNLVAEDEGTRIAKQYGNGTISFNKCIEGFAVADPDELKDTWAVAENVIVIKRDGSKDSVSSLGSISFLEKGTHYDGGVDKVSDTDLKNSNEILEVYTWTDSEANSIPEIVAIVYAK